MIWIQTFTGIKFDLENPTHNMICIEDIAHSLSMTCRYTGHCRVFYPVSAHCVLMSHIVSKENAFGALMHDSAEGFLGDVSGPLKALLPNYKRLEDNIMETIASKFEVHPWPLMPEVKEADIAMMLAEKEALLTDPPEPWAEEGKHLKAFVDLGVFENHTSPEKSFDDFMKRFNELVPWTNTTGHYDD